MKALLSGKEAFSFFIENEMMNAWMDNIDEGIAVCKRKTLKIVYCNNQFVKLLGLPVKDIEEFIKSSLTKEFNDASNGTYEKRIEKNSMTLELFALKKGDLLLLILKDISKIISLEKNAEEIRQLNYELRTIYEKYADDTIFITDKTGQVIFTGAHVAKNCGFESGAFIGKNVYDLERDGIFYPSVSVKVIETKQPQVVIQQTRLGQQMVAIGTPIFNEKGELQKVITISKDFSPQIKLASMLLVMEDEQRLVKDERCESVVTCNNEMFSVVALAKLVASVDSTVLIHGETGTGKDVIAKLIYSLSKRSNKPFVKVNCGAIADNLVESELFGYVRGSFTGANKEGKIGLIEAANKGTLFLDEVSELPLNQQVKLLQVLQERQMTRVGGTNPINLDIRIIAATNRDLEKMVKDKQFRGDLYYRLNVVPIKIPPLRERKDDIPLLAKHFLETFNKEYGKEKHLSKDVLQYLCDYTWPGNVRELENVIERLVVTSKGALIETEQLPENIINDSNENALSIRRIIKLKSAIEQTEKTLISMVMSECGNTYAAAEILGINQSTVSRKIKQYRINYK